MSQSSDKVVKSQEATASSTINKHKLAADQFSDSVSNKRSRKNNTQTALNSMATSVGELAFAFKSSGGETSPDRRKAAIKMIEDDNELSDNEQLKIFKVI